MPSFLTASQITAFTGIMADHFDTFSHERTRLITIHKEPLRTLVSPVTNPMYGYEDSNSASYSYTPVTGIYPAIIMFNNPLKTADLEEIKIANSVGEVKIKVEPNCRDFIEDGRKNEKFVFDNKTFNVISNDGVQNFLGLVYYIYRLQNTQ